MKSEILLYGGSGRLGTALRTLEENIIAPDQGQCDITNITQVEDSIANYQPEVVINSAALVGAGECESNQELAWNINVEGAINVAKVCEENSIRHVFISSAAIFDGKKGGYKESDHPSPTFFYAITKVAAEQAIRIMKDYAIVRLDFFTKDTLKYKQVFTDHYTSKILVEDAAKKILLVARSDYIGIINIGAPRNSLYKILKPYFPDIEPIKVSNSSLPNFPKDISLDLTIYNLLFELD